MRRLIVLVLSLAASAAWSNCGPHDDAGYPSDVDQVICMSGFVIGYNYQTKVADWVMYMVTGDSIAENFGRDAGFKEDTSIPDRYRATLEDYRGSGYDRGHLASRATIDSSEAIMKDSFILSNIAPQLPGFNRRGWVEVESRFRECTFTTNNGVIMVTGAYYDDTNRTIGNGVRIPAGFYKVAMERSAPYRTIAYLVPHRPFNDDQADQFRTSVDDVERVAGVDLYSLVPDSVEAASEANSNGLCGIGETARAPVANPTPTPDSKGNAAPATDRALPSLPSVLPDAKEAAETAIERINREIDSWSTTRERFPEGSEPSCTPRKICTQMSSCAEAVYHLITCENGRLDSDGDGIPCESLCNPN